MTTLSDDAINRLIGMGIPVPLSKSEQPPSYREIRKPIEDLSDTEILREMLMILRMVADTLEDIGSSPMGKGFLARH